ncbi:MAG: hypothetical protein ABI273_14785 [Lacunisphaera sp.]
MKPYKIFVVIGVFIGAQLMIGCGTNDADKERARLNLEEQARRETEVGNKAITDLNRRMFGKKEPAPALKESSKGDGANLTKAAPSP